MWPLRFTGLFAAVVLLMLYVDVGESGVAGGFFKNEAHPGKCYINEKLILSEGGKGKDPEYCIKYHCHSGETGLTSIETCLPVQPPPNCQWTDAVNLKAAYPVCCVLNYHCANPKDATAAQKLQEQLKEEFKRQI